VSSTGAYISRFEQNFAQLCGARTSVGVCNGTVALHLALLALDVRPGDEVLVPSLTFIATANACRYVGAEPVFVERGCWNEAGCGHRRPGGQAGRPCRSGPWLGCA
jgi:perosamine synthetase